MNKKKKKKRTVKHNDSMICKKNELVINSHGIGKADAYGGGAGLKRKLELVTTKKRMVQHNDSMICKKMN